MKPGYRLLDGAQIPTRLTTVTEIMSAPQFERGVADARAGRPIPQDYDLWAGNGQWSYERGRQWACLAPRNVALKQNGKITEQAKRWYRRGDIL